MMSLTTFSALPISVREYSIDIVGERFYVCHVRGCLAFVRKVSPAERVLGRIFGWLAA